MSDRSAGVRGASRPRGNYDTDTLIEVLGELHRFLGGKKATLLWDRLPAHRSTAMGRWLNSQRCWLVVERLPAYAPELNPVEGQWSSLQAVELANLCGPTLAEVIDQATAASSGSARHHSWLLHSSAGLACRSHDHQPNPRPVKRVLERVDRYEPGPPALPARCAACHLLSAVASTMLACRPC
jgi:hypothetical protein